MGRSQDMDRIKWSPRFGSQVTTHPERVSGHDLDQLFFSANRV